MDEHIDGCVRLSEVARSSLDRLGSIGGGSSGFSVEHRQKWKVGVIGLGSVGRALKSVMQYFYDVAGYDITGNYQWTPIVNGDAVFVCVQTPELDGRLDCSHVVEVISRLARDKYTGVVVIKSTLKVGFMNYLTKEYPSLRLVYSPEFMSEKNAYAWTANPDRIVLSGEPNDVSFVESLYFWAHDAEIIKTDFSSAEIGKLAHNAFIALKVTFTNTMEKISESSESDIDDVMRIVYTDRRVRNSAHLTPHLGPYGGKCVPKDTTELISAFGEQARLLRVAAEINNSLLASKDQDTERKTIIVVK